MKSRTLLKQAVLGAVTLTTASAAYADLTYPQRQFTIIASGLSSGDGSTFVPGVANASPPPPGNWETTVQFGSYNPMTNLFALSNQDTIGGYPTGKNGPLDALNVAKYSQPALLPKKGYAKPLSVTQTLTNDYNETVTTTTNSSWVSPFIVTPANQRFGQTINQPISIPLGFGGSNSVFAYTTTFDANPSNRDPAQGGVDRSFDISGSLMSDDEVVAAWFDYGTANQFQLSVSQTLENPMYPGRHTGPYQIPGTFSGSGLSSGFNHSITFFVASPVDPDRNSLNFVATIKDPPIGIDAVPEPGTVAFAVILSGGLLGLMYRARNARRA